MLINKYKQILKTLLTIFGGVLLINGIFLWFTTNFNLGNLLVLMLGTVLLCLGYFFEQIPKWLLWSAATGIVLFLSFSAFLFGYGASDDVTYNEDAVIVLGAGIRGDQITGVLKDRLDVALEYYKKNPNIVFVVSGGQGPQESISEAAAMERYLMQNGVPQSIILKEDRSTSTFENFSFSKILLDEHFGDHEYRAAFVTNEYHVFRAQSIAKQAGMDDLTHMHSNTRWYLTIAGVSRECLAVLKFWVFGG